MGGWREGRGKKSIKGTKEKDRGTQKKGLGAGVRQQIGKRHSTRENWPGSKRKV